MIISFLFKPIFCYYYLFLQSILGPLDYETNPFYSIWIKVSDGSLSTTIKLAVNVLNENEGIPQFINSGNTFLIIIYIFKKNCIL